MSREILETIATTRAVRRFTDEPVTEEELRLCLEAAAAAPSGGNVQPWQFVVVTDPEVRRRLGDVYRRAYVRYEPAVQKALRPPRDEEEARTRERLLDSARHLAEHLHEAPVLVLVLAPIRWIELRDDEGPLDIGTIYASVFPAVQNLMLAARALGIGTTLTTLYRIHHDEAREICGIPADFEIAALIPMGRPAVPFRRGERKPIERVTHWNRFGNRAAGA